MGNKLSIVIQSHQPTLLLGRCLTAVMEQNCAEELEVVVVDHRARRSVHQLIRWWNLSLARQGRRSRVLHLPLRSATNDPDRLGLRACTGSMVAFVDETATPPRDWASRAVAEFQLRESQPPDIAPPVDSRGIVQRRSALMSALAIDDRAVLSAHGPASDAGFAMHEEAVQSFGRRGGGGSRAGTVTRIDSGSRVRLAPVEHYVCLVALIAAVAAALLQNYAVAIFAAAIWIVLTVLVARSDANRRIGSAIARPFTSVWRANQIMRSPR